MRARSLMLIVVFTLMVAVSLSAQQPSAKPAAPPDPKKLDDLLLRWEKNTAQIQTMAADVTCTRKNPVFNNKTEVLEGFARFMRLPDGTFGVHVQLVNKQKPASYEKYVCTGGQIYVFRPEEKAVYVYTLPPKQAQQAPDDGPLPFLFGMKAATAKNRYRLSIGGEVDWYTYVDVIPNFPKDQQDFTYARLAILNRDYVDTKSKSLMIPKDMPREIFWREPNKIEVTWVIRQFQRNVPGSVDRVRDFSKPALPTGWEFKTDPNAAPATSISRQPTVVRPQDGKK